MLNYNELLDKLKKLLDDNSPGARDDAQVLLEDLYEKGHETGYRSHCCCGQCDPY